MKHLVNGTIVEMTDADIAEYNASLISDARILSHKWESIRTRRNNLLSQSDWVVTKALETGVAVTVEVFDGSTDHIFTKAVPGNTVDRFNPDANVWLDTGAVSLADKGNANVSDGGSIMKFLHNL